MNSQLFGWMKQQNIDLNQEQKIRIHKSEKINVQLFRRMKQQIIDLKKSYHYVTLTMLTMRPTLFVIEKKNNVK